MACVDSCPVEAITIDMQMKAYNAYINSDICTNCGACHAVCQEDHPASLQKPVRWQQGWANQADIHARGSSGGFATAIISSFVESGGYVCSCIFHNGKFCFFLTANFGDINAFAGSKYVKSNPSGAYSKMQKTLLEGERVLFVGLPCQVSAARNFMGKVLSKNFYTVDIICHGTPAPQVLEKFLAQHHSDLSSFESLSFRQKSSFRVRGDDETFFAPQGTADAYSIAFLNGATYTENCYSCHYATEARVGDLTLGDSWGSDLSTDLCERGLSLAICQTDKGMYLLEKSNLHLEAVDVEKAVASNGQLRHPSARPEQRVRLMHDLETGKPFDTAVKRCYPKQYTKQCLKVLLAKLDLLRRGKYSL